MDIWTGEKWMNENEDNKIEEMTMTEMNDDDGK